MIKIGKKGQSSIIDALLFMLICASASALMFYTSGIYSENTTKELAMIYNFEFERSALISMHYLQDSDGNFFWTTMQDKLTTPAYVSSYLESKMGSQLTTLFLNSPSSKTVLKIEGGNNPTIYCYYQKLPTSGMLICSNSNPSYKGTVFTSSTKITDNYGNNWKIELEEYY